MPNYIALVKLYIETDSIEKAKMLIGRLQKYSPKYAYSIQKSYYRICKKEQLYKEALQHHEEHQFGSPFAERYPRICPKEALAAAAKTAHHTARAVHSM